MNTEENKALIRRLFKEVLNGRNLDLLPDFVWPGFIEHAVLNSVKPELRGLAEHIDTYFQAFEGLFFMIEDMIAENTKVAVRWIIKGIHTGEFMGVAATGKIVITTGIDIYRFEREKIMEHWHEIDLFNLFRQISPEKSV